MSAPAPAGVLTVIDCHTRAQGKESKMSANIGGEQVWNFPMIHAQIATLRGHAATIQAGNEQAQGALGKAWRCGAVTHPRSGRSNRPAEPPPKSSSWP
ncbi:putative 6 kDa early secretory antigenic target EsaT6 [Mycobacterium xenopi 4042]|uniref:Putative 6 kDa early secretory antigenic target EsaT6 n=1 Tax=Mycobacterium xenopi 4042 TaxID=1299334 RepID=X8A0W4_MYCXE|nr:putative 6 kDa early secretory antigenic target EsaT6 [Mycobacterium xenopi 4042]